MCIDFSSYSDEDLWRAAMREGPESFAWREVTDRYTPLFLTIAKSKGVPHAICEDVAQQSFLDMLCSYDKFDPERGSLKKWARGIAWNAVRKVMRSYGMWSQHPIRSKSSHEAELRSDEPETANPSYDNPQVLSLEDYLTKGIEPEDTTAPSVADFVCDQLYAESLVMIAGSSALQWQVAEALRVIYTEDMSFTEAASAVGVHRSTLRRWIKQWTQSLSSTEVLR